MNRIISLLVVLLGMSGLLPNAAAEIEIKQQQGVRYVTGGLTEEENKQMGKLAQRFPMHIVFKVAGQDEPVQGVDVTVRDISGGAKVAIGSAKGGSQMRVGKGELWWCT